MPTIVVPFRAGGKSRLPDEIRERIALALLEDVLAAAVAVGPTRLVTDDPDAGGLGTRLGATIVRDPGGGQGLAVEAALDGVEGPCLVVNADLPHATAAALRRLAGSGPALVAAADGTTNALALPGPLWFAPLYGPGSAERFAETGLTPVRIAELELDVDTLADLERLVEDEGPACGRRTAAVALGLRSVAARAS